MPVQNVSTTVVYMAYNTSTGAYVTGDVANHTIKLVKDGTEAAPTNSPSEVDSTNAKGAYKLTLTAAETLFGTVWVGGVSSTANVIIVPITLTFNKQYQNQGGYTFKLLQGGKRPVFIGTTGQTLTVNLSQNGGTFNAWHGTATELSNGWYLLSLSGTDTNTVGALAFNITDGAGDVVNLTGDVVQTQILSDFSIDSSGNSFVTSSVKKNTNQNGFMFVMTDSITHAPKTGLSITATRSLDGNAFAATVNSATEVGNGVYTINLVNTDTNGNHIMLFFSATGADPLFMEFTTQP